MVPQLNLSPTRGAFHRVKTSVWGDILAHLFSTCVCSRRAVCRRTAASWLLLLPAQRRKISDGAASSNSEQLETDGDDWCSLCESGRKVGGGGRTVWGGSTVVPL